MPNEDTDKRITELEDKIEELSNKLEEKSSELEDFMNLINPNNLLTTQLDASSKKTIIDVTRRDVLDGSLTWDPGNLIDAAGETSASITVTDAQLGDFVWFSAPYDLQGITANGYVDAADSVKIRLQNETGGAIDLASGDWKVKVYKQ